MAFLTILTRSYKRPNSLARCVQSVARQTDPDVEQRIIFDSIGRGVEWSYLNLRGITPDGEYVMLLDDDNYLSDDGFIAHLKKFIEDQGRPDVVFVEMDRLGALFPDLSEGIRRCYIDAGNVVIKRDVWLEHAPDFKADYSADFYFILAICNCPHQHTRAHMRGVSVVIDRISNGLPE